jgi:predicted enzyme related to lactoylglutathione lyase
MNRPVHFEYHSSKPEVTQAFFEKVLGWKFARWNPDHEYWLVDTGSGEPGINGGLMRSRDGQPRTVNTVHVADLDEMVKKVEAAGGRVVVPKMAIAGVGWLIYCMEPMGNLIGMMQEDRGAR